MALLATSALFFPPVHAYGQIQSAGSSSTLVTVLEENLLERADALLERAFGLVARRPCDGELGGELVLHDSSEMVTTCPLLISRKRDLWIPSPRPPASLGSALFSLGSDSRPSSL